MRRLAYALAHAVAAMGFLAAAPGLLIFEAGMYLKRRAAGEGR